MAGVHAIFASGTAPLVQINNGSVYASATQPANATATLTFDNNGTYYGDGLSAVTWLLRGVAADYQIRATVQSGETPSGTLNTWMTADADYSWALSETTNESAISFCTLRIEIRNATTLLVLDYGDISILAEVFA